MLIKNLANKQVLGDLTELNILDSIGDGISIQDKDFIIRYQNKAHKDLVGGHIGEHCYKAYEKRKAKCEGCPLAQTFKDGKVHTSTRTAPTDKGLIYVEITSSPILDSAGEIVGGIEVVRLTTELKISKKKRLQDFTELKSSRHSIQDWDDIFNTITDMITIHDADFNIIHANTAAMKNLKLPVLNDKADGSKTKCFKYYHGTACPPTGCPSCECVTTGIPAAFELFEPYLNKDIEIRAIPRFDNDKNIIGVIHIARDISRRKGSEKKLKESSEQLHKLTAHLTSVREEERKHIAREIHDELAQFLTALNMDLFWLHQKLPASEEQKDIHKKTESMLKLIDKILQTVSRISSELRPGLLDDLGLHEAMEWQADEFQKRTDINSTLSFNTKKAIDQERATTIFRIFQETLTNVTRHAKAKNIVVSLKEKNNDLILEVKDDGRGITEAEITNSEAFGLIGIRERVHFWKGTVNIKGSPDKGTAVTVNIPMERKKKKIKKTREHKDL